ncbi:unnamed protein product [Haemonchus placei]|uniref:Secreted protein n=1 Tax=Haemonchus placei TaxID=6290 RepID=A0A0N4W1A8_HAEPC|nr:unnamed protein product [Haemonchus placei]
MDGRREAEHSLLMMMLLFSTPALSKLSILCLQNFSAFTHLITTQRK